MSLLENSKNGSRSVYYAENVSTYFMINPGFEYCKILGEIKEAIPTAQSDTELLFLFVRK